MNLSECIVYSDIEPNHKLFKTEKFKDHAAFHSYLINTDKKTLEETIGRFQSILSMFNFYSELRKKAEDEYASFYTPNAISDMKEIPLDMNTFYNYLNELKEATEPPLSLIVEIADKNYVTIKTIGDHLNKVLRRERKLVSLDKVQQIDNQCIRWIAKQPGRTAAQKAGSKQMIKGVIRQESFNTLENRVFKHFLELCIINAISYIKEYSRQFKDSVYLNKVKRLLNLAIMIREQPELREISNIYSLPKPNFVLQNNPRYRIIWMLYIQLVSKQRIIESLWANRQSLYREFISHAFLSIMHNEREKEGKSNFKHFFWIRKYPDKNGQFFNVAEEHYYESFVSDTCRFNCTLKDTGDRIQYWASNRAKPIGIGVAYVLAGTKQLFFPAGKKHRNIIITEERVEIIDAYPKTIVINLSSMIRDFPHEIFNNIKESVKS